MPTHVLQLDRPSPAVLGPGGQGVLQSLLWAALVCAACNGTLPRLQAALVLAAHEASPGALSPYSLNPQAGADPRSLVPALGLL